MQSTINKTLSRVLAGALFFLMSSNVLTAQNGSNVDFKQAANKDPLLGDVHWITSVVHSPNSVYYEGMAVPQRILLKDLQPGTHSLVINHQSIKNSSSTHAYDFLTSWDQAKQAGQEIYPANPLLAQLFTMQCGTEIPAGFVAACADRSNSAAVPIPAPNNPAPTFGTGTVSVKKAAFDAHFSAQNDLMIYAGSAITSASLTFVTYTGGDQDAEYILTWTSSATSAVIEFAGHLASGNDFFDSNIGWGPGKGCGGISGAPYHIRLASLDGNSIGSQDNSINDIQVRVCTLTASAQPVNVTCKGAANGIITAIAGQGVPPYMYSIDGINFQPGHTYTGLAPGPYTITIKDASLCFATATTTITEPDVLSATATFVNATCNGGTNGSIDLTVTGGVAPYTYNWGAGQPTTQDRTGLAAGSYTVIVTDASGCTKQTTVTISQPAEIVLSTTQINVLCFGASTGSIDLTVSDGVGPYTYDWGVGQPTTQDRTGLAAGSYTVIVTDANGCVKQTTVTITQPADLVLSTTQVDVLCFGASTGSIDLTVTGGVAPYTYNWGVGQPTTQDRTGLAAGSYTVIVTDANGCTKQTTVRITEPAIIALSTTQVNVLCFGGQTGSIDLTVTGGVAPYTYNWGVGQPTTQDRTGLAAGSYTVIVTDANGCTKQTTVIITEATNIVLSTTQVNVLCFGGQTGSIDLTVTGGVSPYTYNWGAGQPTTQDRTSLAAGGYTVIVTDANGCTKQTTVTITQPADLVLSTTQVDVLCFGASTGSIDLTVSGGVSPYTYNWGAGQPTTQDRTGLAAGSYTVIVTDANGCTKQTTVRITEPAIIALSTTQVNVLCFGGQTGSIDLTVTGGVAPYTYNWGAGQPTTQDRTGLAAGSYTVIVTDANGCTKQATVIITEATNIVLSSTQVNILCNGAATGSIDLTVTGGVGPYTYNWGAGQPTTQDRTGLAAGSYTVIVTDANGCTKQTTITITQTSDIVLSTTQVNVLCFGGQTGSIDLTVTGGVSPFTYNWGVGQPTTQDRTGLAAGSYTVIVTDANGCTEQTTVTITQPADLVLSTTQVDVLCFGALTGSIDLTVTGGLAPYTYNWGAGQPTTQDRTGLAAGSYTVIVTDANGCTKQTTVIITQPTGPSSIGDYVWRDANGNGMADGGELPLEGVTVSLFEDANTDGIPDGAAIATDITDVAGLYLFTNVCPGNYVLKFGALQGYVRTTQLNLVGNDVNDSDADPATGFTGTINISVNENDLSNDAGYSLPMSPLPVTGVQLKVVLNNNNDVALSWKTLTELNSRHFEIERSVDGVNFTQIGTKQAAGNSITEINYTYPDPSMSVSVYYYRLKLVDIDGRSTYSNIAMVRKTGAIKVIRMYPNPAINLVNLEFSNAKGNYSISMYNQAGQEIITKKAVIDFQVQYVSLERGALTAGSYIIKIRNTDTNESYVQNVIFQ